MGAWADPIVVAYRQNETINRAPAIGQPGRSASSGVRVANLKRAAASSAVIIVSGEVAIQSHRVPAGLASFNTSADDGRPRRQQGAGPRSDPMRR